MPNIPPAHGRSRCSAYTRINVSAQIGLAMFVVLLALFAAQHAQAQEGTVKAQHGAWQVVCKAPPPGAKNPICAAVQAVTDEANDNIGLVVQFQKFDSGERMLRVVAPLGVLLLKQLSLKIDDHDFGSVPFFRCHVIGCQAQFVVEDALLQKLKQGKTAIFIIFRTEEAGIGIPISLAGFADALKELK